MSLDTLSNLSYTNKDFNSIYSELLEYAGKLSYKWDPITSDESDPGVVLLKLAAIIADKDNYNIDKNVLELMPASVTQLAAARQVFEQCGYTMPYYRSALGTLQLTLKNEPERNNSNTDAHYTYTIPQFTMFSDIDKSVVFTALKATTFDVNDKAKNNEKTHPVDIIQGVVKDYAINGDTLVTLSHLDTRNRLYFTEMDIAENGIFISSTGDFSDIDSWTRVDVLELTDPTARCYRFGIDAEMTTCYIEFTENIDSIIGEGLRIKYVRTSGGNGNVAAKRISQFFTETKAVRVDKAYGTDTVEVDITTDNIHISNPLAITNGQDLETIDEAYRNYKRVKNTFDTLVSLNDYTDHMVSSKHASNGYVCDRTNDIQHTYRIVGENNVKRTKLDRVSIEKDITYKDADTGETKSVKVTIMDEPALTAFDLCIYGLQYKANVLTEDDYLSTFKLMSYSALRDTGGYIRYLAPDQVTSVYTDADLLTQTTLRCVQHDFNVEHEEDKILLIKNKYPVTANVIPQYKLTQAQFQEVLANIQTSLFRALNSKMIDFGTPASYDAIYDAIATADSRIRSVSLEYPTYQTYAVYRHDNVVDGKTEVVYRELRIDSESPGGYQLVTDVTTLPLDATVGYYEGTSFITQIWDDVEDKRSHVFYKYDKDLQELWNNFRVDIYAKSILSGVTQLYTQDNSYALGANQYNVAEYTVTDRITTNTEIDAEEDSSGRYTTTRALDVNENVLFTAPNYVTENQYSSYVKMIYDFPSLYDRGILTKDSIYQLRTDNDFIVFFWKASADDSDYRYIKYSGNEKSLAKSICTTFNLPAKQEPATEVGSKDRITITEAIWEAVISHFRDDTKVPVGQEQSTSPIIAINWQNDTTGESFTISQTDLVTRLSSGNRYNVLTGAQTVYTKTPNTIKPNDPEKTSGQLFWILDSQKHVGNEAVLFSNEDDNKETTYTLGTGEYLLYTNPSKTTLHMLGSGTALERLSTSSKWSCPIIQYSELSAKGPALLEGYWQSPTDPLEATEMQQVQIGPGYKFSISEAPAKEEPPVEEALADDEASTDGSKPYYTFNNTAYPLPRTAEISYTDGTTESRLPAVPDGWSVQTILNLNVGPERPQQLKYSQTVNLSNEEKPLEECYILTNQELNMVGGKDLTPKTKSIFNTESLKMLTYTDPEDDATASPVHLAYPVGSFVCTVTASPDPESETEQFTRDIPVSFLPGQYLLKLTCNTELSQLSLSTTTSKLKLEAFQNESDSLNYLYQLNVKNKYTGSITLKFESPEKKTINITIEPFYKYTATNLKINTGLKDPKDNSKDVLFEDLLLARLRALDYDHEFDYLHSVDKTAAISNPLLSTSFLNPLHVLNPFTICQWNIDEVLPKIEILNNVR